MISFSENMLSERLSRLNCMQITAFAASCAERLMPTYIRFAENAALAPEDKLLYRKSLDNIWNCALGKLIDKKSIVDMEHACLNAVPSEDDAWEFGEPYAEDAGAAVTFAVRTWLSCDPQNAVWAARRVYEALDNFVVTSLNSSLIDEQEVLSNHLIQKELVRQQLDLEQLEDITFAEQISIAHLRARAQEQSLTVFVE